MLLIAFMGGSNVKAACELLLKNSRFQSENVLRDIHILVDLQLLVPKSNASHKQAERIVRTWSKRGWTDAADYYLATLDYPFVDYTSDGDSQDQNRMLEYSSEMRDQNRTKQYDEIVCSIPAPRTVDVLSGLTVSFSKSWAGCPHLQEMNKVLCVRLLSAVFGVLRSRKLSNDSAIIADAIRKTSPSGGCRHPTECYIFARSVKGIPAGVYHFNVAICTLDFIAPLPHKAFESYDLFSGPMRAPFIIDAFLVLTSVFERNMYRYREPRTLRTIYMDVGHLLATLEITSQGLGLNCLVQHGISEAPIAEILRIDPLREGVIFGAALGGVQEAKARR